MAGVVGGAIGGGAVQALSGIGSAGATFHMQRQAQQWMKRMRATHYQATVEDLIKAGLNPILAVRGMSSKTPSSPAGSASAGNVGQAAAAGAQAVTAKQLASKQGDLLTAQTELATTDAQIKTQNLRQQEIQTAFEEMRLKFYVDNPDALRVREMMGPGTAAGAKLLYDKIQKPTGGDPVAPPGSITRPTIYRKPVSRRKQGKQHYRRGGFKNRPHEQEYGPLINYFRRR